VKLVRRAATAHRPVLATPLSWLDSRRGPEALRPRLTTGLPRQYFLTIDYGWVSLVRKRFGALLSW